MTDLAPQDLRAAVGAGILSEAQAASLVALAASRAGQRAALPPEDEPFEFFKGFSEIFVSIGLVILLSGITTLLVIVTGPFVLVVVPAFCASIAWWWAGYFTLKRRMNLPSMVLALAFGGGVAFSLGVLLSQANMGDRASLVLSLGLSAVAMALWYHQFRLPFAMFVLGLFALGTVYAATASLDSLPVGAGGLRGIFDLRESPVFALSTLLFGVAAFVAGLWFDTRDPYRLGRHAATGFWLHLLAAPALVNTVAMTLYNTGGGTGMLLLLLALVGITVLALVIDRRSFLSAGIAYLAIVIAWLLQGSDGEFSRWAFILIVLGGIVTAIGTWWVPLRARLMRALPAFPGKDRLPPYAKA